MDESSETKVEHVKNEKGGTHITLVEHKRPWYENMSTVLALLALLFSFGTTIASNRRLAAQDMLSTRQDLRGLVQRLAALPKENVEIEKTYASDAITMGYISGLINQENTLLARQAAELAKRLPESMLSAVEYYSIAIALQNAYDLKGASEYLEYSFRAAEKARDFSTEIAALRSMAMLNFIRGDPESGRVEFQKALAIFSRYPDFDSFTRGATHIWTELRWAESEASTGHFQLARQHLGSAEGHLASLPRSPGGERFRAQISQAKAQIDFAAP